MPSRAGINISAASMPCSTPADGALAKQLCSIIKPGGRYVALRGLPDSAFVAEQAAEGGHLRGRERPGQCEGFCAHGRRRGAGPDKAGGRRRLSDNAISRGTGTSS